jgi:FkbM family methyltransferase
MSILAGLTGYYDLFGVRGALAISSYRLIGRPKEITAWPAGIRAPIRLRVRTSDVSTYKDVLLREEYDFDLPFYPKTIVDAGANIGMASIYYAHKYPGAKIIAVEAEASNFSMLSKNTHSYPNILPLHAALWNRDGVISVNEPDPATGAFGKWGFVTQEGEGVEVRAITMRTLMAEMKISSVDLLKVDIEGAEKEVFESCDWMESVRALVIELHDRFKPGCSVAVNSVTREFSTSQRGEMTLYVRH